MRRNDVIKRLRRMGYEVLENMQGGYVRVFLDVKPHFTVHMTVFFSELELDDSVDRIVYEMNDTITRHFN